MITRTKRPTSTTSKCRRSLQVVAVFALALTGCSSASTDTASTAIPAEATVPTTTTLSTSAVASDEEPLVLVAFGDSLISWPDRPDAGVIGLYAGMLEEEFGVPVDVRSRAVWGSSPTQLLNALGSEGVQADLAEADLVLLEIPMGDSAGPFSTATGWQGRDPADCGGDDNQQCLRDYLAQNMASVEAILAALTATCDPSETLIRALDVYQLQVEDQITMGTLQLTKPYWEAAQAFLEETSAGYGIPVAQVYEEFMGPDGTDDPQGRELVVADQRHPTQAGAQLIAEMIHDLGYDLAG